VRLDTREGVEREIFVRERIQLEEFDRGKPLLKRHAKERRTLFRIKDRSRTSYTNILLGAINIKKKANKGVGEERDRGVPRYLVMS